MSEEENRERQAEECVALDAIYGPEVFQTDNDADNAYIVTLNLDEHEDIKSPRTLVLHFDLPATYPSQDMPVYEITSMYCGQQRVDETLRKSIDEGFRALFEPGGVVLFEWISWLRDHLETQVEKSQNDAEEEQEDHKVEALTASLASHAIDDTPRKQSRQFGKVPDIYTSEPLMDRKSTFVAHIAEVHSIDEVEAVMAKLMENKKIAKATHNIMAYRIFLPNDQCLQDNDDDGETAAGGRLLHLLQIVDAQDVMVVVSRWFGGVLLGADRFKDINNCARQALEACGYIKDETSGKKGRRRK